MTPPPNMLDSANHPGVVLLFPVDVVEEWAGYNFGIGEEEA